MNEEINKLRRRKQEKNFHVVDMLTRIYIPTPSSPALELHCPVWQPLAACDYLNVIY